MFFRYELDNGKEVKIPVKEVDKLKDLLGLTTNQAIATWLADNDYITNEEQEKLNQKAKGNKVNLGAGKKATRTKITRERKSNPTKEKIIQEVAKTLEGFTDNVNIENVAKIITFEYEGKQFKLDLTEKRVKKA